MEIDNVLALLQKLQVSSKLIEHIKPFKNASANRGG